MKITKGLNPVVRAVGVLSAVGIIVCGVTYAAFTNTVTLASNSVNSADASLRIWDGTNFSTTAQGFNITDLIPGEYTKPQAFYLQNSGNTPLKVTAHVPTAPTTASDYGFTGWENLKVQIMSNEAGCVDKTVDTDMKALLEGQVELPCDPLTAGAAGNNQTGKEDTEGNYTVAFKVPTEALKPGATDISLENFNFDFTGTVTSTPVTTQSNL